MTQSADRPQPSSRRWIIGLIGATLALVVAAALLVTVLVSSDDAKSTPAFDGKISAAELAALPELRPDVVIEGLLDYTGARVPETASSVYTVTADTAVFGGANSDTAVARVGPTNELGSTTALIVVEQTGRWSLILTPTANGTGTAQTAGWVRTDALQRGQDLPQHIEISLADQTLAIVDAAGGVQFTSKIVIADKPGVPAGLGYLQTRYTTSSGGDSGGPTTRTSLHAKDSFGTLDGSSVSLHTGALDESTSAEGAIHIDDDAAEHVNVLPLGTVILTK